MFDDDNDPGPSNYTPGLTGDGYSRPQDGILLYLWLPVAAATVASVGATWIWLDIYPAPREWMELLKLQGWASLAAFIVGGRGIGRRFLSWLLVWVVFVIHLAVLAWQGKLPATMPF